MGQEQDFTIGNPNKRKGQSIICGCGARIPLENVYCPRCGKRRPNVWRCQKCGYLSITESGTCSKCGGKMKEVVSTPAERHGTRKKIHSAVLLAAALVLVVIIVLCVVQKNSSKADNGGLSAAIQKIIDSEKTEGKNLPDNIQYFNNTLDAISFEIKSNSEKKGIAQVEFTYVDIMEQAESFGEEEVTAYTYFAHCNEQINAGTAPINTKTIEVKYVISQNENTKVYSITVDEALADVLLGGAYSRYDDILREASK